MMTIRRLSFPEIRACTGFDDLLAAYAAQSSLPEVGQGKAQLAAYAAMDAAGLLHIAGAFTEDGTLTGFISFIVAPLPHYGVPVATTESFFVHDAHRKGGAWKKLLAAVEQWAKELGAHTLLVSAAAQSALERAMPLSGYRHSNSVFARRLI
jgi:GNAT superfamily N-acetyltransferase